MNEAIQLLDVFDSLKFSLYRSPRYDLKQSNKTKMCWRKEIKVDHKYGQCLTVKQSLKKILIIENKRFASFDPKWNLATLHKQLLFESL